MPDITADTFKSTLNTLIEKRMHTMNETKTQAIRALAQPLGVLKRQIWLWINTPALPKRIEQVFNAMNQLLSDMETVKPEPHISIVEHNHNTFPFRIIVPRKSLKISKDAEGNFIVLGSLKVDLL